MPGFLPTRHIERLAVLLALLLQWGIAFPASAQLQKGSQQARQLESRAELRGEQRRHGRHLERERQRLLERIRRLQSERRSSVSARVAANETDSLALKAVYEATGGATWTSNENWLSGPVATWAGVTLNASGRVSKLDLSRNRLLGTLPDELGDLAGLDTLDLSQNNLFGPIPASVNQLTSLIRLNLWNNNLSGSLPSLGNLTQLEDLFVFQNALSGPLPSNIDNLTSIKRLYLDGNNFTGSIPEGLGNLTQLTELFLDGNQLTGPIPASLGGLTASISLFLNDNQLEGDIPVEIAVLPALENLSLSNNRLSGPIPAAFAETPRITNLLLGGNELSGPIPSELMVRSTLVDLHLGGNQLSGPIPDNIGNLFRLKELDLGSNSFTGPLPMSIGFLPTLSLLDLSENQLSGEMQLDFASLEDLRQLYLQGNAFEGAFPIVFINFFLQQEVDISRNAFDAIPTFFPFLPVLRTLDVSHNRLTFEDIEPNLGNESVTFTYAPQAEVPTQFARTGDRTTLTALVGGEQNLYQWYVNDEPIDGEATPALVLDAGTYAAEDSLRCMISSALADALVLESRFVLAGAELSGVTISPDSVVLASGERFRFSGSGADQTGNALGIPLDWSATGGSIDESGRYVAGDVNGAYTVTASAVSGEFEATARVIIGPVPTSSESPETPRVQPTLQANYPNPFSRSTTIVYDLPTPEMVSLRVYDVLGREVATLDEGPRHAGRYEVYFDGGGRPAGLYLYRLRVGKRETVRQMMLVR